MKHFVLVHGAGHGAWCWYKVRCRLESSGHHVSCVDLASAGVDNADANSVLALRHYDRPLFLLLSSLPPDHKVVLVGHSAAGLSIVNAIREFGASKIALAIFVAASMLQNGFVTVQDIKDGMPDLSEFGDVYEQKFDLGPDNPPTSLFIKREHQRSLLYHLSPQEDCTLALMLLKPCPSTAFRTARFEGGIVDEVRRVYVKTAHDRMLKPEQQEAMIRRWPPSHVAVIQSDHSPFFSATDELSRIILNVSGEDEEEDHGA